MDDLHLPQFDAFSVWASPLRRAKTLGNWIRRYPKLGDIQITATPVISAILKSGEGPEAEVGWVCPRCPCGFLHFCFSNEGCCCVAVSAVLLRFEIINLWKTTNLFWTARLVSNDVRLPINSSTAFPFACLNVCFCDRRIHFRFRAFFIFTELKSTAGCFDERRSFVYRQLSHGGFLVD